MRRWRTALVVVGCVIALGVLGWGISESVEEKTDGREEIVFWGGQWFGDDIYTVLHRFERKNPRYRVVLSASAERDVTADSQRMLCAIAGGVPPDVVFFSRFATGEWASRGALTDLGPMLAGQAADDPWRIDLSEYYDFTVAEASYAPPGGGKAGAGGVYGIPTVGDVRVLFMNCDAMRQAGLADGKGEPVAPKTWEELREYAKRLTVYRRPGEKGSGIERLGFAPNFGNSWLYLYAWQAGGSLLSADGRRVTMDSPPVVRALRFMTDLYDDLGGVRQVNAFQESAASSEMDPFVKGLVAMKIDNDFAMRSIAYWKPGMDFKLVPAPMPADELAKGRRPVTWSGGFSLVVPSTSKHKEGAFKLIQYLASWEAQSLIERGKREQQEAEGRMYLPETQANRVFFERLVREGIDENPNVPRRFKEAYGTLRELMPDTLHRPVTPVGQLLWNQHVAAYEAAVNHTFAGEAKRRGVDEAWLALNTMQRDVQARLDEVHAAPPPTVVRWWPWFVAYGVVLVAPFVGMWVAYRRGRREHGWKAAEVGAGLMFVSPWLVGFALLVGGPILFSVVMSFTRYDVLSEARYVGVGNFAQVLGDATFWKSLWNTAFMIVRIPLMMGVSLGIAMLLNRSMRGIGFYRTSYYMPAIVPIVAASLLWRWLLDPGSGVINGVLGWVIESWVGRGLEGMLGVQFTLPVWLKDPNWSKPALILMNLWTAGAGMVIWLAGLQGIPRQLYEAASIDGAGAWRRFWHVTVPMLSPYILFNFIIGVIGTMQIFSEAFILTEGGPAGSTLFYAYYLFRQAFQYFNMGYAAALAWILFVIVMGLTVAQLWLSKRWVHYEQV